MERMIYKMIPFIMRGDIHELKMEEIFPPHVIDCMEKTAFDLGDRINRDLCFGLAASFVWDTSCLSPPPASLFL